MRLILVRHGATANNAEGRFTGQLDVPLSEVGRRQAQAVAHALADESLAAIVSSTLARARQTAEMIADHTDAPLEMDANLREIGMGAWEGLTLADIQRTYPQEWLQWQEEDNFLAPPGGESPQAMLARAGITLDRCLQAYPDQAVLWVTHGGLIATLICQLLSVDQRHRHQLRRDNAGISELRLGATQTVLMRLNETAHLRGLPMAERAQVM